MSEKGPTTINMITSEMEKLRSLLVEKQGDISEETMRVSKEVMDEMKLLVDFVRDKKLEEGSCRLNYLISEVVEMAREAQHKIECHETPYYIQTKLQGINETLHELGESRNHDGVGVGEGDGDMVGFEEDVKLLLQTINSYTEKRKEQEDYVACIEGIPGSGKTTLVRHLYRHADIVQNFDHRVWVDCTETLSHKELLIDLLRQLPGGDAVGAEEMETAHLQQCVVQCLQQGKRFFIVLDDVRRSWSIREFVESLHNDAKGRFILIFTCRRMNIIGAWNNQYMKPLDVDKSWQLLLKKVLLSNMKLPKNVERKGKAMLMKHSGGVPLAIKEVAMEWIEKRRLGTEWEDVVESEDLELRASIEALDSSVYHYFIPNTKSCFQHLSFFKLGTAIRTQRFMDTLVASGLLDTPSMYQMAFEEFKKERIVEVEKHVRINPIFHKLSIMKAKKGEDDALHRVIYCSREKLNCSMDRNKQIKCLSFNGGGCFSDSPSYWKSFEELRVLEFEGFGLKFLPETVGELIELRYLGLRNNYIQELPRSLGNLRKLEVLDIAHNFMVEVPDIIWEMEALRDLYMSDIFCMKPLKIEALRNLQTLNYISVDNWAFEVSGFQVMTYLYKLVLEGLDMNSDLSKLFLSLNKLEHPYSQKCLVFRGFRFKSMPSLEGLGVLYHIYKLKLDGLITKLPCPEVFPHCVSDLILVNSNLDDDPMPTLEKLPSLQYLKLQNAYSGQLMVISGTGFPHLRRMCIKELWHLRNIQVGGEALEFFQKLEITNCPYLHSLSKEITNE